jgi:hypothetical protein
MSELTDAELLAELRAESDAFVIAKTELFTSNARLDACLKCEFRHALVCTKIQPKGDSRLNLSAAIRRVDVECPEGKWG